MFVQSCQNRLNDAAKVVETMFPIGREMEADEGRAGA